YNGLGDRVRVDKPTGTRRFVYDTQGRVLAEYGASAGEVWAEFIWALPPGANDNGLFGGGDGVAGYAPLALVAQNVSGLPELYWVHGNHLGVPQVTTNATGQVTNPGDDFLRPGFPGQSQVLTDLYYNRARDYDPVLGRYIQADPIGLLGGANPYLYAGADPVNMVDPSGEIPIFVPIVVGALIGGGAELLSQGVSNYMRGRPVFDADCYDWGEVVMAGAIGATGSGTGFRILYRFGPRSLTRETGLEWSHSISRKTVNRLFPKPAAQFGRNSSLTGRERFNGFMNRQLNKRGGLNGSWATLKRHYRHDRSRSPVGWRQMGNRLPPSLQALDRIPDWLKVSVGSGVLGAAATGSDQ
ncbi:MAG: RHS repeat-associated core domain-containing protein, partial [Sphingomonadaceae bacterium]|nr:RHS repeat-associated core domain-containing protein [Sphingomonadaceae bacterium]